MCETDVKHEKEKKTLADLLLKLSYWSVSMMTVCTPGTASGWWTDRRQLQHGRYWSVSMMTICTPGTASGWWTDRRQLQYGRYWFTSRMTDVVCALGTPFRLSDRHTTCS